MAPTITAKEAVRQRLMLTELGRHAENGKIALGRENQSAIALASNPVSHQISKNIDIQHHHIRNEVDAKQIQISYIPTTEIIAHGLTKPLLSTK